MNNQNFSVGRSLKQKQGNGGPAVGGMGSSLETKIHQLQLFWGFIFGEKRLHAGKLVCSGGSDITMERLHPLPQVMLSIFLFPDCMKVGKTLGSVHCRCATVG